MVNNYIRQGRVTYTTVAVSRRPSSRWAADAAEVTADGGGCPPRESDVGSGALTLQRAAFKKGQVRGAVDRSWRLWWGPGVGWRGGAAATSWSSSDGCGRPCDHAGQFPAVF